MEKMLVNIEPGSSILGTYRDQSYKLEGAFAEFIDNSTQSFFNNRIFRQSRSLPNARQ